MSDSQQQHEDLRDRLADLALRELLSQESPPDLADSILAAAATLPESKVAARPDQPRPIRTVWATVVIAAACLLLLAAMFGVKRAGRNIQQVAKAREAEPDQAVTNLLEVSESLDGALESRLAAIPSQSEVSPTSSSEMAGVEAKSRAEVDDLLASPTVSRERDAAMAPKPKANPEVRLSLDPPASTNGPSIATADGVEPGSARGGGYGGGYGGGGYGGERGSARDNGSDGGGYGYGDGYATGATLPREDSAEAKFAQRNLKLRGMPSPAATRRSKAPPSPTERSATAYGVAAPRSTPATPRNGAQAEAAPRPSVRFGDQFTFEGQLPAAVQEAALKRQIDSHANRAAELAKQVAAGETGRRDPIQEMEEIVSDLSGLRDRYEILRRRTGNYGVGPEASGEQYTRIYESPFIAAKGSDAVSTFSIDVDTASYANVRQYLLEQGQLPPADAVRIEELVNYFDYDYAPPTDDVPIATHSEVASCPWQPKHRLVRIGVKARVLDQQERLDSNLVFLVDVSGSMQDTNKLPLVVQGLRQLTNELSENDKVAIVVYANKEGLVLPATRGHQKQAILAALDQLRAGGSTAGGAGIQLAYQVAERNFISGGINRVLLCTDGDFNVGVTNTAELERMAEQKAKSGVFLTVLGFGRGNLNDAMMESISNKGNGNYHYVDNEREAGKVLVRQRSGTLVTIAKDVKIQVEFNPARVSAYRLLGYENRMLARADFADDAKDAGEIGAGHTVTAFYEVIPIGRQAELAEVEPLKYQQDPDPAEADDLASFANELMELRFRYKEPNENRSKLLRFAIEDQGNALGEASTDFRFAASVAGFGLLLRGSQYRGNLTMEALSEIASESAQQDEYGYRNEFLSMLQRAQELGLSAHPSPARRTGY